MNQQILSSMDNDQRRNTFLDELKDGVCKVSFTKVNGDKRVMIATLNASKMNDQSLSVFEEFSTPSPGKVQTDQINVIDMDIDEWRSFNVNSVSAFEMLSE